MKTIWSRAAAVAVLAGWAAVSGCATAYSVRGVARGEGSEEFAEGLASDVRSELLGSGYRVLGPDGKAGWFRPVVDIDLRVSKKKDAQLGDWRSYESKAKATVQEKKGALLGEKSFTAKSGRTRSEEGADEEMRENLADQIGDWLRRVLNPAR